MTALRIPQYACVCGARDEGEPPAKCWSCGGVMKLYGWRTPLPRPVITSAVTCGLREETCDLEN